MAAAMARPAAPRAPDSVASIQARLGTLVDQSLQWVSTHSLQILVALAIGTAIVAALLGIKHLGMRLCREARTSADWRTIVGRVIARTSFLFMVVLAAHLVAGYAYAPDAVAHTIRFLFVIGLALQRRCGRAS